MRLFDLAIVDARRHWKCHPALAVRGFAYTGHRWATACPGSRCDPRTGGFSSFGCTRVVIRCHSRCGDEDGPREPLSALSVVYHFCVIVCVCVCWNKNSFSCSLSLSLCVVLCVFLSFSVPVSLCVSQAVFLVVCLLSALCLS